jgi:hypothetical protein
MAEACQGSIWWTESAAGVAPPTAELAQNEDTILVPLSLRSRPGISKYRAPVFPPAFRTGYPYRP